MAAALNANAPASVDLRSCVLFMMDFLDSIDPVAAALHSLVLPGDAEASIAV